MSNQLKELQALQEEIQMQFTTISQSFYKLSEYFTQMTEKNTNNIASTNTSSNEEKKTPSKDEIKINNNDIKLTKRKRLRKTGIQKDPPGTSPLHNIGYGRVFPVYCYEKGERIRGYKVQIKYYKLFFSIGPYKKYDFACNLNSTLQEELSNLKCNEDNYRSIVTRCFDEIKTALYKEFPPLSNVSN